LAFLVVPVFILAGYFIRVLNRTAGGDEVPPVFDEWGELAVTGLQAVLIGVAYARLFRRSSVAALSPSESGSARRRLTGWPRRGGCPG